jgi:hypothetical protein
VYNPCREPAIMAVKLSSFSLNLPFHLGGVTLKPDSTQKKAAWELYIELVTRVATQEMAVSEGLDREALKSLYNLFPSTRRILRSAGPGAGVGQGTLGGVAIKVLNQGLRPFLTRWHTRLSEWEHTHPGQPWPEHQQFRAALAETAVELSRYSEVLATIAGVGDQL